MAIKKDTSFDIEKKPGPMALVVEATGFTIYSKGDKWVAKKNVTFMDDDVNVTLVIRGQKGEEYKMTMEINSVSKDISGKLADNGKNTITKHQFPLSDFNLTLT